MHILRVSRLETAVPIRSPKKMKTLVGIIITIFGMAPSPDAFSKQVRAMADRGLLKDENAQVPIIAFLSQVMSANPKRIPEWIDEASDLDEKQRNALLAAAWYSDTAEARDLFKKQERDAYLKEKAPDILVIDVNNPSTLDMLWGYFMATGDYIWTSHFKRHSGLSRATVRLIHGCWRIAKRSLLIRSPQKTRVYGLGLFYRK